MPPPNPATGVPTKSGTSVAWVVVLVVCLALVVPCTGILVALLLPAVQAAREAARRSQCSNNLKHIALALQSYQDAYNTFPPAYIPDENGKPKHSWRVLILPFLEQRALFDQYDFDEPWDSPNNRRVTNTAIPEYKCPTAAGGPAETNYMVITGPGTMFEGAKGCSAGSITDGTSNTIMVVEVAGTGRNWADPTDLDARTFSPPFNPPRPDALGSSHPGGMQVALADGSVRFVSNSINSAAIRALTTKAGGEVVPAY